MHIRVATPEDAPELLAIYAPYVERTAITFEYDVPTVEDFRGRVERTLRTYPYLAMIEDDPTGDPAGGRVLGYAYVGTFQGRKAYEHSVETSIYVREDARGHGIGRALHDAMESKLRDMGVRNLYASIAYPHSPDDPYLTDASVRFHEHMGYRLVAHFDRCGYKFDRWYDDVIMEKIIGDHPLPAPTFTPFDGRI